MNAAADRASAAAVVAPRVHGGADAQGPAPWDFSTCSNAAGPCPQALAAVRAADPTRYPDPASTRLRQALAHWHGVAPARVLMAASASEFIQRLTAVSARLLPGAVQVPALAYGDYALAAAAWARTLQRAACTADAAPDAPPPARAQAAVTLSWHADPSSPLGQDDAPPAALLGQACPHPVVLDAVYAPLRLGGTSAWGAAERDAAFVLHSPNKALGLTGLRGAYAIAPASAAYDLHGLCAALQAAAPSWPLSAPAEAMLLAWTEPAVQRWLQDARAPLARWKQALQVGLTARGFALQPSQTPFFVAQPPQPLAVQRLRAHGVAVRDTGSFGLRGAWRLSAQPPAAQAALWRALERELGPAPGRSPRRSPGRLQAGPPGPAEGRAEDRAEDRAEGRAGSRAVERAQGRAAGPQALGLPPAEQPFNGEGA